MPREAVKNGYIHYVVSLNEMADTINKYALSI
jgi:chemotaxis response regulator CheB